MAARGSMEEKEQSIECFVIPITICCIRLWLELHSMVTIVIALEEASLVDHRRDRDGAIHSGAFLSIIPPIELKM